MDALHSRDPGLIPMGRELARLLRHSRNGMIQPKESRHGSRRAELDKTSHTARHPGVNGTGRRVC